MTTPPQHDTPACCQFHSNPTGTDNFKAWWTSVQQLQAGGTAGDRIAPYCGEPVAKLLDDGVRA